MQKPPLTETFILGNFESSLFTYMWIIVDEQSDTTIENEWTL